ncbi:MAG: hypothetical protein AAB316_03010 [Bacteroidota bacterium]
MKKFLAFLFFAFCFSFAALTTSSCNRGTGCPMNENVHVQPNKKGNYPKTRTRSGLFPKGMEKRTRSK